MKTLEDYIKELKSLNGLSIAIGTLVPALSYFTRFSPPFLKASSLLTGAIALATVVYVYYYPYNNITPQNKSSLLSRGVRSLIASVCLLVLYIISFDICTVTHPGDQDTKLQIGFGRCDWSLTAEGKSIKEATPGISLEEFVLKAAAFSDDKIKTIWKPWTVYLSGTVTTLMFMSTFILWNLGWALFAKQKILLASAGAG
jgi:hypothetical protein